MHAPRVLFGVVLLSLNMPLVSHAGGNMNGMRLHESVPIDIREISARTFRSELEAGSCERSSPYCR